jgi:hypothetical protein
MCRPDAAPRVDGLPALTWTAVQEDVDLNGAAREILALPAAECSARPC